VADALIQLTCGETIEWLKDQMGPDGITYYDRWFLPKFDLNKGTDFFGRPVGNHPEWMPWDDCLNKDVDDGAGYHVTLTSTLSSNDQKKFDLSTPPRQDHAYMRIFDPKLGLQFGDVDGGFPKSVRIIADAKRCYGENVIAVVCATGKPVKLSAGNRKTKIGGHGGPRTKGAALEMDWIHEDAKGVSDDLFAVAAEQALGNPPPVTRGAGIKPYHSVCDWMAGFIN
jgi:hypothetical protein